MRAAAAAALLAAGLVFAVAASAAPLPRPGVHGDVKASPTCPVASYRPEAGCDARPVATTIRIYREGNDKLVKKVRSSKRGRFRARLRPGRYVLRARETDTAMYCAPATVEVEAHRSAKVHLDCDTGLR